MTAPIIGLVGPARSGKDTVADTLRLYGYRRRAFADRLKEAALDVNPDVCDRVFGITTLRNIVTEQGWEEAKRYPAVRGFLQRLGTAVRDHVDPLAWVSPVIREAKVFAENNRPIVITDVRFPNELDAIRDAGGVTVLLRRDVARLEHVSEDLAWTLTDDEVDHTIQNDSSIADLKSRVASLVGELSGTVGSRTG